MRSIRGREERQDGSEFHPEEEAFREEVRSFLKDKLSEELATKVRNGRDLNKADMENWHATLNSQGWLAPGWPVEHGGTDWDSVNMHIFEEECARANAPRTVPFGLGMLGPGADQIRHGRAEGDHPAAHPVR